MTHTHQISPTSGSKERNIQTYKYGKKATKNKEKQRASVDYFCVFSVFIAIMCLLMCVCRILIKITYLLTYLHVTMLLHAIIQ